MRRRVRIDSCGGRPASARIVAFVALLTACSGSDGGSGARASREPVTNCVEAPEERTAPGDVMGIVQQLNAMEKPISLPCFVETLPRPLGLAASASTFSAQPATGDRSPRIFLFVDPLVMTVVPEGMGSNLVEVGERRSETRSLKAEIEFPLAGEIEPAEPFERILFLEDVTDCAFCHGEEDPDPDIDFAPAFVSDALRPTVGQLVGIDRLRAESDSCDPAAEPERCALLRAVFDWGEVVERAFPEAVATFP